MVTATKVAHTSYSWSALASQWSASKQRLLLISLMVMVLMSAVAVTYLRCMERDLVSGQQTLVDERQALQVKWGQLLLEKSTWSNPVHIQQVAEEAGMIVPQTINMVEL
jgi:cell division protein FtsL